MATAIECRQSGEYAAYCRGRVVSAEESVDRHASKMIVAKMRVGRRRLARRAQPDVCSFLICQRP